MKTRPGFANLVLLLATLPLTATAQVPVDSDGKVIGPYEPAAPTAVEVAVGNEDIPLLSDVDLEELVGPIALYPDDLLAIVLPASAYPLQIVDAARFLEELELDASLKPNPEWDDSVVALLNYPEVIELLNDDIDWTWRLGEAVIAQQGDLVAAIETFRDRAYAAGNLKSDSYQNVTRDEGVIEITPVSEDVIYVPYYEPERVVVYQPRPVYYYYPRSYPVYYYPYSSAYDFHRGYFWGVTTAFTIGWMSDSLNVYHHSYYGHPYFGYTYRDNWWYRRPSINVYNTTYVRNSSVTINHYYNGDRWNPRHDRRSYARENRVTHNRQYQGQRPEAIVRTQTTARQEQRRESTRRQEPITFRDRSRERNIPTTQNSGNPQTQARAPRREPVARQRQERNEPVARQRPEQRTQPVVRQRQEQRTQPVVRQRQEQRTQPVVRQRQEQRTQPVVRQRQEQRAQPVVRQSQQRSQPRSEPKPRAEAKRSESRSESRRGKERSAQR